MEKGIKSRQKILEMAFKLFAKYSYPDVSYSLLEEATDISRGSMVYYFKNKEGIFRAVINDFLFRMGSFTEIPADKRGSLHEFYSYFLQSLEEVGAKFADFRIKNLSAARLNIERNAAQFMPEFCQKQREYRAASIEVWKEVISNSIASGELRTSLDVEVTALTFLDSYLGFIYSDAFAERSRHVTELQAIYDNLYSLIRS